MNKNKFNILNNVIENNNFDDIPVGKHNHISDDEFDEEELNKGIEIEYEHTDDLEISKAIAKDHLSECSDYYTRLEKMENECEEDMK